MSRYWNAMRPSGIEDGLECVMANLVAPGGDFVPLHYESVVGCIVVVENATVRGGAFGGG